MAQKQWAVISDAREDLIDKLTASLNIHRTLSQLLVQRRVTSFPDARDFFRPSLDCLHDPFEMKDMDVAIKRIDKAIDANEKILVYGDYDVDGTTAVALVYSFLKEIYNNLDYYIPDRYREGYGVSMEGIDYAAANAVGLIIALDCGIKAGTQIDYAKSKGIDFIVVDHHRPDDALPNAEAILDPKRADCTYPYKELSGCGLGFKLAQAYYQRHKMPFEKLEKFLDLVAASIAADIVPITGENRILAHFGLKRLNLNPRAGFESILFYNNVFRKNQCCDKSVFTREIGINDLMFMIGPRLNAAGRIENGKTAVDLLLCENMGTTHQLSQTINSNNEERRSLDTNITEQALAMISGSIALQKAKATVLFNPNWSKGVIGIVASRLMENYYRPTIILTENNGVITGSARSIKDFDIYNAIDACRNHLDHFGGHKYAAGLSLRPENLQAFIDDFNAIAEKEIDESMMTPLLEIDAVLGLSEIDARFYRILKQFAPFGPGNHNPVFLATNCIAKGLPRIVGNKHLKFFLSQPQWAGKDFPAIAFGQSNHLQMLLSGQPFDVAYQIEENEWNGKTSIQLNVKDLRASKSMEEKLQIQAS